MSAGDCRFRTQRVAFANGRGDTLAGVIDCPEPAARGWVLLNHCFTCGKDLKSLRRIARRLAGHGLGCLRFDATGLGHSGGVFADTNLTTLVADTRAAAGFLAERFAPPRILFGHSLGAVAALAVGAAHDEVRGVVTLASSATPEHLRAALERMNPAIAASGAGEVEIGGQRLAIRRQMLDDLSAFDLDEVLERLRKPVMLLHGAADEGTPIDHARRLFDRLRGPATFVTLPGADHLLFRREADADDVGDWIELWSRPLLAD